VVSTAANEGKPLNHRVCGEYCYQCMVSTAANEGKPLNHRVCGEYCYQSVVSTTVIKNE